MPRFERIQLDPAAWHAVWSAFPDRIVFQSPAWIAFLAETQRAEPVLAALREGDETLGHFTGLIVRQFGLRILGSPFRGWSTPYMGFNLRPGVPRRRAAEALPDFAFRQLGCIHFEVTDAHMTDADVAGLGFTQVNHPTLEVDLTQSETALFDHMTKSCRWTLRRAEKNGLVIEEAHDARFAEEFSEQLADVFAKQRLMPPFGLARVQPMIRHLHPTGMLLLLRARDPQRRCIASGIFPAANLTAFYLCGASWRQYQRLYPNELLQWHAMQRWKKRGIAAYNMVGNKDFKQKFGGRETSVPMFYQSKYRWLGRLRASAIPLGRTVLRLAWRLKSLARARPATPSAPQ